MLEVHQQCHLSSQLMRILPSPRIWALRGRRSGYRTKLLPPRKVTTIGRTLISRQTTAGQTHLKVAIATLPQAPLSIRIRDTQHHMLLQVSQRMLDHPVVSMVTLRPLLAHEKSPRAAVKLHGHRQRPNKVILACSSPLAGHRNHLQTHRNHRRSSSSGLRNILRPNLKHQDRLGPHHSHLLSHHLNKVTTCP
jgi:hypothetical protein